VAKNVLARAKSIELEIEKYFKDVSTTAAPSLNMT